MRVFEVEELWQSFSKSQWANRLHSPREYTCSSSLVVVVAVIIIIKHRCQIHTYHCDHGWSEHKAFIQCLLSFNYARSPRLFSPTMNRRWFVGNKSRIVSCADLAPDRDRASWRPLQVQPHNFSWRFLSVWLLLRRVHLAASIALAYVITAERQMYFVLQSSGICSTVRRRHTWSCFSSAAHCKRITRSYVAVKNWDNSQHLIQHSILAWRTWTCILSQHEIS